MSENLNLDNLYRCLTIKALDKWWGNRNKAATELGVTERTIYHWIKKFQIVKKQNRHESKEGQET